MSDFTSKYSQWDRFSNNVLQHVRFWINCFEICRILNQQIYNMSTFIKKVLQKFLYFEWKSLQCGRTSTESFYRVRLRIRILQLVGIRNKRLQDVKLQIEKFASWQLLKQKVQHVRYRIKSFTTCRLLNQSVHHVSNFMEEVFQTTLNWLNFLQRVRIRITGFTRC